jgi:hypothetical protein
MREAAATDMRECATIPTVAPEDDVAADEPALPTADAALAALNDRLKRLHVKKKIQRRNVHRVHEGSGCDRHARVCDNSMKRPIVRSCDSTRHAGAMARRESDYYRRVQERR